MPRRPILDGPAHSVHLHSPYIVVFMQRCGMIYVLGGSLTLRYKGKGNLLIDGRHRKDYGGAPATSVKAMEMHQGPRPVKGGPGLMGVKTRPLTKPHGGSRGPVDPWSASTASKRWDLWFFRSRKNNDATRNCQIEGRRAIQATNLQDKPHQRPIKEKYNVRGAEWGGAKAPKIVPQPSQTSKNPPFWWF